MHEVTERAGADEIYSIAVTGSNLRVGRGVGIVDDGREVRSMGDIIAAAGMNPHRLGLALLRLRTEWDRAAKPRAPEAEEIAALAITFARVPEGEHAGLVAIVDGKATRYLLPLVAASRQAAQWHEAQQRQLVEGMRSLPWVRDALIYSATAMSLPSPEHLVPKLLLWWLSPTCLECGGVKLRIIEGTGRTSGKRCGTCRGSGEESVPYGSQGRKMLGVINDALRSARKDLTRSLRKNCR